MKKQLIVLFITILISQIGGAQTNEAYRKDILKMLELSKTNSQFEEAKAQLVKMIPKENQAAFIVELNASIEPIYNKFVDLYMKEFSHEDIKSILKFYESPLGKKMNEKSSTITSQVYDYSKEWAEGVKTLVMKHMTVKGSLPPPPQNN